MRVRWITDAANDLERICDSVAETSPDAARRIAKTIVEGVKEAAGGRSIDELAQLRDEVLQQLVQIRTKQADLVEAPAR